MNIDQLEQLEQWKIRAAHYGVPVPDRLVSCHHGVEVTARSQAMEILTKVAPECDTATLKATPLTALAWELLEIEDEREAIMGISQDCDGTATTPLDAFNDVLKAFEIATTDRAGLRGRVTDLESQLHEISASIVDGPDIGPELPRAIKAELGRLQGEVEHWKNQMADSKCHARKFTENDVLEAEVAKWKDESGLAGAPAGDPGDVTPEAAGKYWRTVEARVAELVESEEKAWARVAKLRIDPESGARIDDKSLSRIALALENHLRFAEANAGHSMMSLHCGACGRKYFGVGTCETECSACKGDDS